MKILAFADVREVSENNFTSTYIIIHSGKVGEFILLWSPYDLEYKNLNFIVTNGDILWQILRACEMSRDSGNTYIEFNNKIFAFLPRDHVKDFLDTCKDERVNL